MAVKKAVVQEEVKKFRCCGAPRTPEALTPSGKCRACLAARSAAWRKENIERAREIARKSESKRYDAGLVTEYRAKNRSGIKKYSREWYQTLPEEKRAVIKEQKRERALQYYRENRDKVLAKAALRRAEEKVAKHNASL